MAVVKERINVKHNTKGNNSHPLRGQFPHFFLQFVQDMKVWLVLFGILLELDHTLVRVLLQKDQSFLKVVEMCLHNEGLSSLLACHHSHLTGCSLMWQLVTLTRQCDGLIIADSKLQVTTVRGFYAERHLNCFQGLTVDLNVCIGSM